MAIKQLGTTLQHWRVVAAVLLFMFGGIIYFSIWLWAVSAGAQMAHTWYWPGFATVVTSLLAYVAPDKTLGVAVNLLKGFSGTEDP